MANGTVVTRKGLQLITKLVASETALTFTRVAIGTGKVPGGYDPGSMTGLNEYKMDGSIASHSASGDEASVVMQISSIGVETGFTITEAGLFATDPDEGEILYAYLDMSADPQYMYPENNAISKFIEMTLVVKIGEVQSVTAVINPGSLVTKEKFDEIAYPTLPKLDESKNEQDYILDGGEDIRWLLARYEYVKQHYAKSIDLMDEKRTSVHQNDIINGFGEGVTGDLVTVMGTILGQKHDTDINYLKNYGLMKSMITQANVDSLDKIPSAYLLYQLNKDLLDKYEDLLKKYNELNSNMNALTDSSISIPSGSPVTGNRANAKIYQNSFLVLSGEVGINFTNLKNWTGYNILQCANGSKYTINFICTDENGGSFHMQIDTNGIIKLSIRGYLPENKSQILRFFCIAPIGA